MNLLIHPLLLPSTGKNNKIDCNQDWLVSLRKREGARGGLEDFGVPVRANCGIFCAPQIYLRFLDYEMQNSNECKRNFVAVYDGSSAVEDLKAKFCSTVANDVMLRTGLGVVRMWADEGSRSSRFQMLFTSFQERKLPGGLPCGRTPLPANGLCGAGRASRRLSPLLPWEPVTGHSCMCHSDSCLPRLRGLAKAAPPFSWAVMEPLSGGTLTTLRGLSGSFW